VPIPVAEFSDFIPAITALVGVIVGGIITFWIESARTTRAEERAEEAERKAAGGLARVLYDDFERLPASISPADLDRDGSRPPFVSPFPFPWPTATHACGLGWEPALDDYVTATWGPVHLVHLAAKTQRHCADLYDRDIAPSLGRTPLREITRELIGRCLAERQQSGSGPVAIRHNSRYSDRFSNTPGPTGASP
jgi:hypothetical protein